MAAEWHASADATAAD